jgi:arsenite/tail-anchored protein-transporting ATPase
MSLYELLSSPSIHFILFGGKGGVGKTSCAAASSIWAADQGKKVLVISTDPAHSLADSLGQKLLPGEVTKINEVENLWALEIKPKIENDELEGVMSQVSPEMAPLLMDTGSLTPPGMDEAMAFGKVLEFLQNTEYDLIIFDTAPTGHTLRLLGIPDMLSGWMGKMIMLKLKMGKLFSGLKSMFSKAENPEAETLDQLQNLKSAIEAAKEELSNPSKTSFVVVLISELMAIYETERLLMTLMEYEIPAHYMIINQLIPEKSDCEFCKSRSAMQQNHLKEIKELYEDEFSLVEVDLFPKEIRKIEILRKLAAILMKN